MKSLALLFVFSLAGTGCTVAPPGAEINDPYEPFNRQFHAFNKTLDQAVLRPLARAGDGAPEGLAQPVVNFASNTGLPGTVVNNLLQGDIGGAATNTLRFIVNSTVGILGLADPASTIGLREVPTDFGATLAKWGVPEGAYLELPGFGPSTERDATGRFVDFVIDPLGHIDGVPREMRDYALPARLAGQVVERGQLGETFDDVLYGSADSYAQARLIYLQNRRYELGQDQSSEDRYINPYEDQ